MSNNNTAAVIASQNLRKINIAKEVERTTELPCETLNKALNRLGKAMEKFMPIILQLFTPPH